jgi:hypothetical protein
VFVLEAIYFNVASALDYRTPPIIGSLGFAAPLFSFGYVALQIAFSGERRLLAIENELAIAREIQASILPSGNPQISNLVIATAYRPMTGVAGDFFDFIFVDARKTGILVRCNRPWCPSRTHRFHDQGGPAIRAALCLRAIGLTSQPQSHSLRTTAQPTRFGRLSVSRHRKEPRALCGRWTSTDASLP